MISERSSYNVQDDLVSGIDVGGTMVQIADSKGDHLYRHGTGEYDGMYAVLDEHFRTLGAIPSRIVVGMAGIKDEASGSIALTNSNWPPFDQAAASEKYGTSFLVVNDMVITAAGELEQSSMSRLTLKTGHEVQNGTKLVIALSTGMGVAASVWDPERSMYHFVSGEGGHAGFQPKNAQEESYLTFLNKKYPHASAELALAGKHGIHNLVEHGLDEVATVDLDRAIDYAVRAERPVGVVLKEFATQGEGNDKLVARQILATMGGILGSFLRDLALTFKSSGGVYLTGSVALGLSEYLAQETDFNERFVLAPAEHHKWLKDIPIELVTNPNVAVEGALAMARRK